MNKAFKAILILVLLWLITLAIRWPNLNRPLSKHHEFCTAVVLRVYAIWDASGFANFQGLPVMNYPGDENKWINNFASGSGAMHDKQGNYYYVSHPPLAYYLPYFTFKLLGLESTVLNLQLWHTVIHLSSALLLFCLIALVANSSVALWTGIFYLFHGVSLWFQSNVYMSDMLVQFFFISSILAYILVQRKYTVWRYLFLVLSSALMIYCSWLSYFAVFTMMLHTLFKKQNRILIVGTLLIISGIVSAVFVWQYAQINGWEALMQEWTQRAGERAGFQLSNLLLITKQYLMHYAPVFLVLLFLYKKLSYQKFGSLFFLFFVPILLLHIFLADYSTHDFTVLFALSPLAFLLSFAVHQLNKKSFRIALSIALLFVFLIQYFVFNLPGEQNYRGDRYDYFLRKGEAINAYKEDGYVLFLWKEKINPQSTYYAACNTKSVNSQQEAMVFLKQHPLKKGKILYFEGEKIKRHQIIKTE